MLIWIILFDSIVTVGDFLLAVRRSDALSPSVCVVRNVVNHNQVRVTWWLIHEELTMLGNVEAPLHLVLKSTIIY